MDEQKISRIDRDVLARVAATPRTTQRWLKTALQTIRTMPTAGESRDEYTPPPSRPRRVRPERAPKPEPETFLPDLDDLLTGRRALKEQQEARPELAEELEGLSDIIDLLKEAGKRRRDMGEDVLEDELRRRGEEEEEPDDDVFG